MNEGSPVPPPESEAPKQNSPEKGFDKSWLIDTEQEFDDLRSGKAGTPGKKIAMMHQTGLVNTLNADQIADRVAKWGEEAVEEGDEVLAATAPYFISMTGRVQMMREAQEGQEPFPESRKVADTLAAGLVGAVVAKGVGVARGGVRKVGEAVAEKLGKQKKEKQKGREPKPGQSGSSGGGSGRGGGGTESQGPEPSGEKDYSELTYAQLRALLRLKPSDPSIPSVERQAIETQMNKLIADFLDFENGDFLRKVQARALETVRFSQWDKVYNDLIKLGDNLEAELRQSSGDDLRWAGILKHGFASEAARVVLAGIESKKSSDPNSVNQEWYLKHGYSQEGLDRLQEEANSSDLEFLPGVPEQLVGAENYEVIQQKLQKAYYEQSRGATSLPPKEIRALFKQSVYGLFEESWKERIEFLDVTKKEDRDKWILLNMSVFNDGTLPSAVLQWKHILDTWTGDLRNAINFAQDKGLMTQEGAREARESENDLIALMAVSASARAMELSGGDPSKYGRILSQSADKPILDIQDDWDTLLLHNHPEKFQRILDRFGLIGGFYKRILKDAHIKVINEWEVDSRSKKPSRFGIVADANGYINQTAVEDAGLLFYLENNAERGGFDGYTDHLLNGGTEGFPEVQIARASGVSDRVLWSMSKIANDMFLTDKFTRWIWLIDKDGSYKAQPLANFGGDPLRALLEPSFLPKVIKKVYQSSRVLQLIDMAFRPQDIFKVGTPMKDRELTASMAVHFKHYQRWSQALAEVVGTSQADGIANWSDDGLKAVDSAVKLLNQVYGNNKDIVGAMVSRIIYAKAQALVETMSDPSIGELFKIILKTEADKDPFEKIAVFLWGPNKDGNSGYLRNIAGTQYEIVFKENKGYKTREFLEEARKIFITRSKTPTGQNKATLIAAGQLIAGILSSLPKKR